MKNIIIANRVVFKAGNWFTKLFMITMPIFVLYGIFGDMNLADGEYNSLISSGGSAWFMVAFFATFLLLYPIRNYWEVKRLVKAAGLNPKLAMKYERVLEIYNEEKSK